MEHRATLQQIIRLGKQRSLASNPDQIAMLDSQIASFRDIAIDQTNRLRIQGTEELIDGWLADPNTDWDWLYRLFGGETIAKMVDSEATTDSGGFFSALGSSLGKSLYSMGQTYFAIGQYALGNSAGANQTLLSAYENGPLGQAEKVGSGTYYATAASLGVATAATAGVVSLYAAKAIATVQATASAAATSSGAVATEVQVTSWASE